MERLLLIVLSLLSSSASGDGSAEATDAGAMIASLTCAPPTAAAAGGAAASPALSQTGAWEVHLTFTATSARPVAVYVTDTDDTVLAAARDVTEAAFSVSRDVMSDVGQRLVPHAVYYSSSTGGTNGGCTDVRGAPLDSWQSRVDKFDYAAAGGVHAGMHDEALLAKAVPTLSIPAAASGGAGGAAGEEVVRVSMARMPSLYVPLLYVKCQSTEVIGLYTFNRSSWPRADDAPSSFVADLRPPSGFSTCLQLYACAAMPAQEACGGFPQRCAELDRTSDVIERIRSKASGRPPTPLTPASLSASLSRQGGGGGAAATAGASSITIRAAPCRRDEHDGDEDDDVTLVYATDANGALLGLASGGHLQLQLAQSSPSAAAVGQSRPGENATAGKAGGRGGLAGGAVTAYRVCGPGTSRPVIGYAAWRVERLMKEYEAAAKKAEEARQQQQQQLLQQQQAQQARSQLAAPPSAGEVAGGPASAAGSRRASPSSSSSSPSMMLVIGSLPILGVAMAAVVVGSRRAFDPTRKLRLSMQHSKGGAAAAAQAVAAAEGAPLTAETGDAEAESI